MKSIVLLICLFTNTFVFTQSKSTQHIVDLEIPQIMHNEQVIKHFAYSFSYNETHEQANWVAYELTKEETQSIIKRGNNFKPDSLVLSSSANNLDYLGSGYDRGHLAPAADMGWSAIAMEQSFYYSNMSPQNPSFNRGIWKKTEELVRTWAQTYNTIYIVTGPVLSDSLASIGPNKVSVPKYYYKVMLDYKASGSKAIGFIIPNIGSKELIQSFAVSIDSVEKVTGINFFDKLPDDEEIIIEKKASLSEWVWTNTTKQNEGEKQINKSTTESKTTTEKAVQCSGQTKKGIRCKNKTKSETGKCKVHQ